MASWKSVQNQAAIHVKIGELTVTDREPAGPKA
jgi:hypothetical protein